LVGMGFFHTAATAFGRWRLLEVLLKTVALLFAGVAAIALAGVVDELILKPLLVVPADRLASGHPVPADDSVLPKAIKQATALEGFWRTPLTPSSHSEH
jgi:hypothetical protein